MGRIPEVQETICDTLLLSDALFLSVWGRRNRSAVLVAVFVQTSQMHVFQLVSVEHYLRRRAA